MIHQFEQEIYNAMQADGLMPPEQFVADGKIHRFSPRDKRNNKDGWYVIHQGRYCLAAYGDWCTGISRTLRHNPVGTFTSDEEAEYRAHIAALVRQRNEEEFKVHAEAAAKAASIWCKSKPAPDNHPYLLNKGIKSHGARVRFGALVIPVCIGDEIHSLLFIAPNGQKRFLAGGRIAGCYFLIGDPKGELPICVAEGFATAATLHEATGYPIVVAFSAGNLRAAAESVRRLI